MKGFRTHLLLLIFFIGLFGSFAVDVPRSYAGNTAGTFDQANYRWRNDDGSQTTATWMAATSTPLTGVGAAAILRLRLTTKEGNTCSGTGCSLVVRLEFSSDATSCTTGSWTTLTTSSPEWDLYNSANFTNAAATTQQLSESTFTAGSINDTSNPAATITITKNSSTEHEWAIQGNAPSAGTDYYFRLTRSGTLFNSYTNCAKLTTGTAPTVALNSPADAASGSNATPTLNFTGTDPDSDSVEYNVQIDTINTFNSQAGAPLLDKFSISDSGFTAGHPFASGAATDYTVQVGDTLTPNTYYWRVAAIDPLGSNTYGAWSGTWSFTVTAAPSGSSPPRSMHLFEGFKLKITGGRIIIYQHN